MFKLQDDLDAALAMANRASHLALTYFKSGVAGARKLDGSPVTEADYAVEKLLRDEIRERRPGDGVLGEELGDAKQTDRNWIIDPIDGTGSFIERKADWRVQLALEIDGQVAVAVVDAPAQGVRWWAASGSGTFEVSSQNDRPSVTRRLSVSATNMSTHARVQAFPIDKATESLIGWKVAELDSVVPYKVIRGELDAFIFEGSHAWDHAPWILLVEEAGGRFTDWDGGRSAHKHGGLFSNADLHVALALALGVRAR